MNQLIFCKNIQNQLAEELDADEYSEIVAIVDSNTFTHCWPLIQDSFPSAKIIKIQAGEEHKTLNTCQLIWDEMTMAALDRKSLVINLGGGVIGDMGGFCASTYKRGVDFINIPTTLLAQVDASIGGKLGIDFHNYKNHIGLFNQPQRVFIDTTFLRTLPDREIRSGYAEVIKHTLIADKNSWDSLKSQKWEDIDWQMIVENSVKIKQQIAENDPFESGRRKILNFGHTVGHAVESYRLSGNPILHGEAVALGMICEAFIAKEKDMISQHELDEILSHIDSIYDRVELNSNQFEPILDLMYQDKKNTKGKILFALPKGIGRAVWDVEVSTKEIISALNFYTKS